MEDEVQFSSNSSTDIEVEEEEGSEEINENSNDDLLLAGKPSDVDACHSNMCKEWIPTIGMQFDSEDNAQDFYNRYAYKFGFGIRKSRAHKTVNGFLTDRLFVCSAEGKRQNDKRNIFVKVHRAETRFNCQAKMKIKYDPVCQKYVVTEFIASHTHLTSTPRKTHRFRSHRKMSLAQNVMVDMADDSGIAPKQTLELLNRQAGGRENLGFIVEDYRNYLRSRRTKEMQLGDTGGVLEYLQQMQSDDPNFTYAIQVDVDECPQNHLDWLILFNVSQFLAFGLANNNFIFGFSLL